MPKPTNVMGLLRAGQQAKSLAALGTPEERLMKLRLDAIAAAEGMMRVALATNNPSMLTSALAAAQKAAEFFESSKPQTQDDDQPQFRTVHSNEEADGEIEGLAIRAESPEVRESADSGAVVDPRDHG